MANRSPRRRPSSRFERYRGVHQALIKSMWRGSRQPYRPACGAFTLHTAVADVLDVYSNERQRGGWIVPKK